MKKIVLTVVQIIVTLGILWVLFHDAHQRAEMLQAVRGADRRWLLAGIAIYGLVEIFAGIRWQILLRVQGIQLGWVRVFLLLLIGVFFNFIIPGGTGGDVVKVFYLLKETPGRRSQALLSVLVDRLIGLIALIPMAGILIAARWSWLVSVPETARWVWTALAILGVSFFVVVFSFLLTTRGWIYRLPERLPGRERLAEMATAYQLYGRAWRPSLAAFVLSILIHFGYFTVYYAAAAAFHASQTRLPSLGDLYAILPVVNTITSMPVSFGGLGVREGLFQIFLGKLCGVPPAVALVMSSTGYCLTLFWGLIGGVLYLVYRPSAHARMSEMQKEVDALEHDVAEKEIDAETSHRGK